MQSIETQLIRKIRDLVSFPADCYSLTDYSGSSTMAGTQSRILDESELLENSIQSLVSSQVQREFVEEQDSQVLKFLNGRKQMIELNSDITKERVSISSFRSYEDKVLLIFCIIIVKNINNLLLEVGPLAVKAFFSDLKRDLLMATRREDSRKRK